MNPAIDLDVFMTTLEEMEVFWYGKEYRLKGFLFGYTSFRSETSFVTVTGRIPLPLAQKLLDADLEYQICLDLDQKHLSNLLEKAKTETKAEIRRSSHFKLSNADAEKLVSEKSEDDLFVTSITINSVEGLRFVVNTIRQMPYTNEWAFGNN